MVKTVVELDLKGYGELVRELEEHFSADIVLAFNEQLQGFVSLGLTAIGIDRSQAVMATTGDGAILAFSEATEAHGFAVALHEACRLHNQPKTLAQARRWFRVGIATGALASMAHQGGQSIAGSVITRAVRLEAAAGIGEVLADAETYAFLPSDIQARYGPEEWISGKGTERFAARRCIVVGGLDRISSPQTKAPRARSGPALNVLKEKLAFFEKELAVTASAPARFELKFRINEARDRILELGGEL
jgi:class 3 adenylate cyclase